MPILGSNTSGAPSVFYPETYGAVGDGTTNDQAAIQACIDAVSAAGGGTVQFSAKTYLVNGTLNTSQGGRSLLALPNTTAQKWITLKGVGPAGQIVGPQAANGTIIKTTVTGLDATGGIPSVIGCTLGAFSISHVRIQDLAVLLPANPTISGIDLYGVTRVELRGSVQVNTADFATNYTTQPTSAYQFGVRMPTVSMYDLALIDELGCYGQYTGLVANTEHLNIVKYVAKWCRLALGMTSLGGFHAASILMFNAEWCATYLSGWSATGPMDPDNRVYLSINLLDIEDGPVSNWYSVGVPIADVNNNFFGHVRYQHASQGAGVIYGLQNFTGCYNLKLVSLNLTQTPANINVQTGTAYTLSINDAFYNQIIHMNNAAANTLTIPPDNAFQATIGTVLGGFQLGAGQTAIAAGAGVTLRVRGLTAPVHSAGQFASWAMRKIATNDWVLSGDLVA